LETGKNIKMEDFIKKGIARANKELAKLPVIKYTDVKWYLDTEYEEGYEIAMLDLDWDVALTNPLLEIQRAVTVYSFGFGYSIGAVSERVEQELENAPLYRLNQIAKDLGLELEKEFIGFN
jgi:hypothetical protein